MDKFYSRAKGEPPPRERRTERLERKELSTLFEEHDYRGSTERDPRLDFLRHRECPRDPKKIALLEGGMMEATAALEKEIDRAPLILAPNPRGATDYSYVTGALRAAGRAGEGPLMMRLFAADRVGAVILHGTDRQNGMDLCAHHHGRDGEWLAMWEHGLELHETGRTTYVSAFNDRIAYDLLKSRDYALAIYDGRGLLSCQPSRNATDSYSNGHHLFLVPPRAALLAVVSW